MSAIAELKHERFDKANYIRLRYGFLISKFPYYNSSLLWRRAQNDWINYKKRTGKQSENTKLNLSKVKTWIANRLSSKKKKDLKELPSKNGSEKNKADKEPTTEVSCRRSNVEIEVFKHENFLGKYEIDSNGNGYIVTLHGIIIQDV